MILIKILNRKKNNLQAKRNKIKWITKLIRIFKTISKDKNNNKTMTLYLRANIT